MAERKRITTSRAKTKSKTTKRISPALWKEQISGNMSDYFRFGESYTSLILGILVVVITSILLLSIVHNKSVNKEQQTSSTQTQRKTNTPASSEHKKYTIKKGDTLWSIAEKEYNSGYNWVDIAKANNLTNPGMINAGNSLIIPSVSPKVVANANVSSTPTTQAPKVTPIQNNVKQSSVSGTITGKIYTVKKGDYLWEIAVRAYGDGYRWVDIAKANNLTNPGLIFSGNKLTLPR